MNTTTKAQRTNKRQNAIWEKAKAADKSAHTPGPWAYAYGAVYGTNSEGEWLGARLLLADRNDPSTAPTERDANCRLAAAAPDLLKELKHARTYVAYAHRERGNEDTRADLDSIDAAIAKAEGSAQ